jgi:K+-sensing histidine kinase KdpD
MPAAILEGAGGLFPQVVADARCLSDTRDAPGWRNMPPWVGENEVRSAILLPLILHGETYGSLCVGSTTPNTYTEQHFRVARSFAERVCQALWNARLYQLEQERAEAAEHLATLRSDFVSTVSHELRTPLTAVLGYAEILEGHWTDLSDDQRRQRVQRVVAAANRLKRLINDLLRVTTFDAAATTLARQPIQVWDIATRAIEVVNASYASQVINAAGEHDLRALADPSHTEQILINLLDNAAKYSEEGSPIEIHWVREAQCAAIRVRDHGPGVPEKGRDVLFSRFGRIAGSRMRAGRVGTGLGLYLGREYADAMGGSLDLDTTGPDGSEFCLRLPLCMDQNGDDVESGD